MKKNAFLLIAFLVAVCVSSCKNQDDIYMEFVKKGGYVYPEMTNDLKAFRGYKRVKLVWKAPKDPSVTSAKVYWNNKAEVKEINYASFTGNKIEIIIDKLEERSYTFELINFDSKGNQSMPTEITVSPYAENWLLTHAERSVVSAEIIGSSAEVVMSFGTDEMIATRFRYIDINGKIVELGETMDVNNNKVSFPDAATGRRFQFSSSYCPADGLDTIWNDWIRSPAAIAGLLDCKSWNVMVTDGQIWSSSFMPSEVVDGIINRDNRWVSAQGTLAAVFPKIMVIDSQKDSYYINKVSLYQDQATVNRRFANSVEMYWGNVPFDPDAGNDYANSPGFADAIAKGNWLSTTFWFSTATWTRTWSEMQNFQYFAIVWKNSRSGSGWIDLWEIEFYGYDADAE
jgi:hypothetical protein